MSLRSMTGFGVAERGVESSSMGTLAVEIRSVNSRFLELKIRQPFGAAVEHDLRKQVEKRLGRGRVDLRIRYESASESGLEAMGIDAASVSRALETLASIGALAAQKGLELSSPNHVELLRLCEKSRGEGEAVPAPDFLGELVDSAIDGLLTMRESEGDALERELRERFDDLGEQARALEASLEGEAERLREQLRGEIEDLLGSVEEGRVDSARLEQELAILLSRGDVREELARISSHLEQAKGVLCSERKAGQGKTLDFLSQELLREVTTIGSKITSHAGSSLVIAAKGSIEKIREQVQNVE